MKPPNSRRTTRFRRGQITGIVSEQAVLVDDTPRHVRDIRPALNTNPLASSGSGESSNDELWIRPIPRVPDDPTANTDADADSSDGISEISDEEVQTIPLRRSARKKRPRRHATCVILRPVGSVNMKVGLTAALDKRGFVYVWRDLIQ